MIHTQWFHFTTLSTSNAPKRQYFRIPNANSPSEWVSFVFCVLNFSIYRMSHRRLLVFFSCDFFFQPHKLCRKARNLVFMKMVGECDNWTCVICRRMTFRRIRIRSAFAQRVATQLRLLVNGSSQWWYRNTQTRAFGCGGGVGVGVVGAAAQIQNLFLLFSLSNRTQHSQPTSQLHGRYIAAGCVPTTNTTSNLWPKRRCELSPQCMFSHRLRRLGIRLAIVYYFLFESSRVNSREYLSHACACINLAFKIQNDTRERRRRSWSEEEKKKTTREKSTKARIVLHSYYCQQTIQIVRRK